MGQTGAQRAEQRERIFKFLEDNRQTWDGMPPDLPCVLMITDKEVYEEWSNRLDSLVDEAVGIGLYSVKTYRGDIRWGLLRSMAKIRAKRRKAMEIQE